MAENTTEHHTAPQMRTWEELRDTGLLWLINTAVLHPRGFALAVEINDAGEAIGWAIVGDGLRPWTFPDAVAESQFPVVEAFLDSLRSQPQDGT
jgi:hypothetical protein